MEVGDPLIKNNQQLLNRIHVVLDAVVMVIAYMLAWFFRFRSGFFALDAWYLSLQAYMRALIFVVPGYLILYYAFQLYTPKRVQGRRLEAWHVVQANVTGIACFIMILYLRHQTDYSRKMLFVFLCINISLDILMRNVIRIFLRKILKNGLNQKQILLIGYSRAAEEYIDRIIQNPERFCFGMDAVLLSGFARAKKQERCLDLGCGNGIIPILMEAKTEGKHFTGLEIQPESADMARRSVALNGLQDRIDIVEGDIKDASKIFGASSFHVVTTNPPYMTAQHGLTNLYEAKTIARHEVLCNLEDIIRESARLLMPGGRFYMVHRPFRLAEIISLMVQYRMEPKRMRLVYPYVDREPNMVLIEGLRGGKSRMTVEKPLIVYKEPGKYTDEIYDVYGY